MNIFSEENRKSFFDQKLYINMSMHLPKNLGYTILVWKSLPKNKTNFTWAHDVGFHKKYYLYTSKRSFLFLQLNSLHKYLYNLCNTKMSMNTHVKHTHKTPKPTYSTFIFRISNIYNKARGSAIIRPSGFSYNSHAETTIAWSFAIYHSNIVL